ncbi:MAG: ureidoglycolate lyase [Klebsiella michiganensis]|nr:ureidoglycolate lyase [Klebsiella michiganensis]
MHEVMVAPVDASVFSPFGILLSGAGIKATHKHNAANSATCIETIQVSELSHAGYCDIDAMEKHDFSTQTFFPLDMAQYLIVVCASNEEGLPDITQVRAFSVQGNEALQYHPGTWHCNIATLYRPGLFVNLVEKNNSSDDCTHITVPTFRVRLPNDS